MKKHLYIFLLLLAGCTQEYEINQEFEGSKLYVTGMLSPQRGLEIHVNQTFDPFSETQFNENGYKVVNAEIAIYEGDQLIDSGYQVSPGQYASYHPELIEESKVYRISVSSAGLPSIQVDNVSIPVWEEKEETQLNFVDDPTGQNGVIEFKFTNPTEYTLFLNRCLINNDLNYNYGFTPDYAYEVIEACHYDSYYFSNNCISDKEIDLQYILRYKPRDEDFVVDFLYFEIGKIDPNFRLYTLGDDAGFDSYIVPTLAQGNVENGYGYIVGKNVFEYIYYK